VPFSPHLPSPLFGQHSIVTRVFLHMMGYYEWVSMAYYIKIKPLRVLLSFCFSFALLYVVLGGSYEIFTIILNC
jgi:hypothetical protein